MLNFCFALGILLSGATSECQQQQIANIATAYDLPRPWLEADAYMKLVFAQVIQAGATPQQLARLRLRAYAESCNNPRVCVIGGCGPFQHLVTPLARKHFVNTREGRSIVRWLLTNKPGYAATTALDLLQRCEKRTGEHWLCCYKQGAFSHECQLKWDKRYRQRYEQDLTMAE